MKFLIAFAAVAAVAVASPVQRSLIAPVATGPAPIVAEPISIGAPIIPFPISPISVGPAIVEFPVTPVIIAEPVVPEAIIGHPPTIIDQSSAAPLVQIIVNVAGQGSSQVTPGGAAEVIEQPHVPGPVNIVDYVVPEPISPVQVVNPVAPGPAPVNVVDNIVFPVSPVQVAEPIVVSPVQVGTPIIPSPVVALPDSLN